MPMSLQEIARSSANAKQYRIAVLALFSILVLYLVDIIILAVSELIFPFTILYSLWVNQWFMHDSAFFTLMLLQRPPLSHFSLAEQNTSQMTVECRNSIVGSAVQFIFNSGDVTWVEWRIDIRL